MTKITYITAVETSELNSFKNYQLSYKTLRLKLKGQSNHNTKYSMQLPAKIFKPILRTFNADIAGFKKLDEESIDLYMSASICIVDLKNISDIRNVYILVYFGLIATALGGILYITASKECFSSVKSLLEAYLKSKWKQ